MNLPRFGKERQRHRRRAIFLEHLQRAPPGRLLGGVDLPEIQHLALHGLVPGHAAVLHHAEIIMILAILAAMMCTQKHVSDYRMADGALARGLVSTAAVLADQTALAERHQGKKLKNRAELTKSAKVGLTVAARFIR